MGKKTSFIFGFTTGLVGGYALAKYVVPMSSREDLLEKTTEMKDLLVDSLKTTEREELVNNFYRKTNTLKDSLDQKNEDNAFEDIVVEMDYNAPDRAQDFERRMSEVEVDDSLEAEDIVETEKSKSNNRKKSDDLNSYVDSALKHKE